MCSHISTRGDLHCSASHKAFSKDASSPPSVGKTSRGLCLRSYHVSTQTVRRGVHWDRCSCNRIISFEARAELARPSLVEQSRGCVQKSGSNVTVWRLGK